MVFVARRVGRVYCGFMDLFEEHGGTAFDGAVAAKDSGRWDGVEDGGDYAVL